MSSLFETGFFVRKEAWHRLGNVIENVPSTNDAYDLSGLNWNVLKIRQEIPFVNDSGMKVRMNSEDYAIIRDSDMSQLGTAKAGYRVFQNREAFNWCHPLAESEFWDYETAGALNDGKVCWILLKHGEQSIIPGDNLKQYLLVMWSHDGSKSVCIQPTTIRVVCNNTLQVALGQGGGNKVRHTTNMGIKLEEIQAIYDEAQTCFQNQLKEFEKMLNMKMSDLDLELFANKMSPVDPDAEGATKTNQEMNNRALKEALFGGASGSQELGIVNTAYGAFNAFSEVNEHYWGKDRIKDRGANILMGLGQKRNEIAFNMARNWDSFVII